MANDTNELDVAGQVAALREAWNPAPKDNSFERLVGIPTDAADVAATASLGMDDLNTHIVGPADSKVDAQRLSEFQDDADVDEDDGLDELSKEELKDEADARGLAVSGSKDDLKTRIREHDAENA